MINIDFEGNWKLSLFNGIGSINTRNSNYIESHITNRQKHAIIAEFGSGIYNEGKGSKGLIYAKKADSLIIPVSSHYAKKYSLDIAEEAKANAAKHPAIMSKIKSKMPGIIGFIFRKSIKGMRPIRMVRNAIPKIEKIFIAELEKVITHKNPTREMFVTAVNTAAAMWLREIVKNSPVLTANMKTGWTISKIAK